MNQILYTNNQKKKGGPLEINTVLRIFAILCILFGLIIVGQASFAMLNGKENVNSTVPLVDPELNGDTLILKIKHDKAIDKIVYSWNENEEIVLQGKGRLELEEKIDVPVGNNTLVIKVTDITGKTVSYSENYELEEGDVIKPQIELLVENSKVKIVAKDETAMDYIIFYWNEEDETRIDVREESLKQIEEKIEILKGENTLTIIAVDKAGNATEEVQTYKGVKKPQIRLEASGNQIIIKASDEEGIQKIEFTLNGQFYSTDSNNTGIPLNMKEVQINQNLQPGQNKITVKVYSISGLTTEGSGETTI